MALIRTGWPPWNGGGRTAGYQAQARGGHSMTRTREADGRFLVEHPVRGDGSLGYRSVL